MIIRDATDDDLKQTNEICNRCWEEFYPDYVGQEMVEQMVADRRAKPYTQAMPTTLVAEENGKILGFCYFEKCMIIALYIHPGHTNKGVGHELITEAFERMRRECTVARVCTMLKNERGLRFYRREGFVEKGPGKYTSRGVTFDVINLEKKL